MKVSPISLLKEKKEKKEKMKKKQTQIYGKERKVLNILYWLPNA